MKVIIFLAVWTVVSIVVGIFVGKFTAVKEDDDSHPDHP